MVCTRCGVCAPPLSHLVDNLAELPAAHVRARHGAQHEPDAARDGGGVHARREAREHLRKGKTFSLLPRSCESTEGGKRGRSEEGAPSICILSHGPPCNPPCNKRTRGSQAEARRSEHRLRARGGPAQVEAERAGAQHAHVQRAAALRGRRDLEGLRVLGQRGRRPLALVKRAAVLLVAVRSSTT
jgi:hypothetical protein